MNKLKGELSKPVYNDPKHPDYSEDPNLKEIRDKQDELLQGLQKVVGAWDQALKFAQDKNNNDYRQFLEERPDIAGLDKEKLDRYFAAWYINNLGLSDFIQGTSADGLEKILIGENSQTGAAGQEGIKKLIGQYRVTRENVVDYLGAVRN